MDRLVYAIVFTIRFPYMHSFENSKYWCHIHVHIYWIKFTLIKNPNMCHQCCSLCSFVIFLDSEVRPILGYFFCNEPKQNINLSLLFIHDIKFRQKEVFSKRVIF